MKANELRTLILELDYKGKTTNEIVTEIYRTKLRLITKRWVQFVIREDRELRDGLTPCYFGAKTEHYYSTEEEMEYKPPTFDELNENEKQVIIKK